MNMKAFAKKLLEYLPYIMLIITCALIGLIAIGIYNYYKAINVYNEKAQLFYGEREKGIVKNSFAPLVTKLEDARSPSSKQLNKEEENKINYEKIVIFDKPVAVAKDQWIPYPGGYRPEVSYEKMDISENSDKCFKGSNKESNQSKPDTTASAKPSPTPQSSLPECVPDMENTDKYVSIKLLGDIIGKANEIKNSSDKYAKYNEVLWKTLFNIDKESSESDKTFMRDYSIGKIFIASQRRIIIFPQGGSIPPFFEFSKRPWWVWKEDKEETNNIIKPLNENNVVKETGLTTTYADIAGSETNITDLTRTLWFRFSYLGREYLFGVDLRLNPQAVSLQGQTGWLWDNITWLFIALSVFLAGLFASTYFYLRNNRSPVSLEDPTRVYKLQRVERKNIVYDGGQDATYKISRTESVKNSRDNKRIIRMSGLLSLGSPSGNVKGEIIDEKAEIDAEEKLTSMTLTKEIDLRLDGNLKSFELWRVYHPNAENYVLGMIGVLWQNRPNDSSNDITTERYFWDSNTSASEEDISLALKNHLHTSENPTFLFDQGAPLNVEPDIVSKLKEKVPDVAEFADKFDSFNNRRILFDNTASVLEQLYKSDCEIYATCSIEFLDNLKKQKRIKEVLELPVKIRYIIDGENRKFKDFYKDLDDETKEFFISLRRLMIIEFRTSQKTIYQNRDFCIVSFGKDKCVFYTDMNNAQQGWVSWREVDIDYYQAIKSFIESGEVEKKNISNYLA
jgi:hypothetical protein